MSSGPGMQQHSLPLLQNMLSHYLCFLCQWLNIQWAFVFPTRVFEVILQTQDCSSFFIAIKNISFKFLHNAESSFTFLCQNTYNVGFIASIISLFLILKILLSHCLQYVCSVYCLKGQFYEKIREIMVVIEDR
jgi:hypothetical protein